MPVKFRIGFEIDAETLFGIVAKFLPLENLSVEEVMAHRAPPTPRLPKTIDTPKIKRRRQRGENGGQIKVIADYVRARGRVIGYGEIGDALAEAGFARAGAGSAVKRALARGVLVKHPDGGYAML